MREAAVWSAVWAVIFSAFAVPRQYQHRVLFLGVVGALVMRAGLIALGAVLIGSFSWVLYVFGAFLVLTGVRMLRHRDEHADIEGSRAVAWLRRVVPHTPDDDGARLVVRRAGRWVATLLLMLVIVEVTDLVFAVDSVPAIFAVTQEPSLVFTANAFAVLGLRAMYFLLADLMHRFVHLKTGLSLVLVWVGVLVGTSVVWSLRATRSKRFVSADGGHGYALVRGVQAASWGRRRSPPPSPTGRAAATPPDLHPQP